MRLSILSTFKSLILQFFLFDNQRQFLFKNLKKNVIIQINSENIICKNYPKIIYYYSNDFNLQLNLVFFRIKSKGKQQRTRIIQYFQCIL